jgi:hypothetical protein
MHACTRSVFHATKDTLAAHKHRRRMCVCVCVCVCVVCYCLKGEQSPSASVPGLDSHVQTRQTSKQVAVPRCGLTSDRKAAPRPPAPARRQSQFMWTLKMHVTRIRLQEHSRRYDAVKDGDFALQSTFFGVLERRAALENLT